MKNYQIVTLMKDLKLLKEQHPHFRGYEVV